MAHCTSPPSLAAPPPPTPSLSPPPDQLDACRARSDALLADTLRAYASLDVDADRAHWRRVGGRAGVAAFRARRTPPRPAALPLRCVGTLRARLDDVLAAATARSSDAMRAHISIACPRVARCAVLHASPVCGPGEVFAGVQWAALRVLGGCVADRDVVYFERAGFVRPEGRRLAFLAMQSVPPAMAGGLGRAGAAIELCYLLEELRGGGLGVYMLGSVQGFGPARLMAGVFADLALAITRAPDVAVALKLAALMQTAPDVDAGVYSDGSCCQECGAAPSVLDALKACAGCRRPRICRRCRVRERVLARDSDQLKLRSAVFCVACRAYAATRPLTPPSRPSDAAADALSATRGPADELLGSLGVFSLKISQQLRALDRQDGDARASALSSLGTDDMARLLLSSGHSDALDGSDEERDDVLASFHTPRAKPSLSPSAERPRLSRYSTASSSSSSCAGDEALEAHRQSLLARLQAAADQAELTFHLAHAHSRAARAVWMRSRFQWLDDGE